MRHLVKSFQTHLGNRGVHFYDDTSCNFLSWAEVLKFADTLAKREEIDPFANRLTETLANYDPDKEFLAVHQEGDSVSVELYSSPVG
jgi:hypothetical protein